MQLNSMGKNDTYDAKMKELESGLITYRTIISKLNDNFIDRADVIDALACGFITGTNVLLIGDPGTAKSSVVEKFARLLGIDKTNGYFSYLLTKNTDVNDIIGTLDIKKLRDDSHVEYILKNKLPEAKLAFIDEIFNANSAILNSMLSIINEKTLLIGDTYKDVSDLTAVFGASNHVPEDKHLKAFFDRFPVRVHVKPVDKSRRHEVSLKAISLEKEKLSRNVQKFEVTGKSMFDFAKLMNNFILYRAEEFCKNEKKSFNYFNNKINHLVAENEIYISDRSLKYFIKMIIARSILRTGNLHECVDYSDIMFVLSKVWEREDQADEILKIFEIG